jgi:hypothetical protein
MYSTKRYSSTVLTVGERGNFVMRITLLNKILENAAIITVPSFFIFQSGAPSTYSVQVQRLMLHVITLGMTPLDE